MASIPGQSWVVTHQVMAQRTLGELNAHLEALSTEECLQYLRRGGIGRVAFVAGAMAVVLPVDFGVVGEQEIVFLTSSGSKLRAIESGCLMTFEVDHFGNDGVGWSVLATGPARATTDPSMIELVRALGVVPHAPGQNSHAVSIEVRFVTGRRFGVADGSRALHRREP